jgi:nucleotide-binding universal stress UspA family protein
MGSGYAPDHSSGMAMNGTGGPVVCGIGDGDVGRRVAAFAGGLADALGATLIAVRAERMRYPGGSQAAVIRGHARLGAALSEVEREHEAVTCTVQLGDTATALLALAAEKRAQLLVVGAGSAPASLGPVPRELTKRASCPIVVLPRMPAATRSQGWQRGRLLCAFDGSDEARPALGVAAAVAERLGTAAFVVHMSPGSVDDLRARAQSEQTAFVVASSQAVERWQLARSGQDCWARIGPIPLLLVPPAYGAVAASPVRAAAAV